MKSLRTLFEYQKFNPNTRLQSRIDAVAERYLSCGAALSDDALTLVAAAGEPCGHEPPAEGTDADFGRRPGRGI